MMKLLSQSLTNNKNKSRNIYKSLIHLLLYFQIINNQSKAISFQSISLTNLNLTTIKPAFMTNPSASPQSPIPSLKKLQTTQLIVPTPPPRGHVGLFQTQTQNVQQASSSAMTS